MARGFRGMKDDFVEIINHIIGLTCCSIAHDDRYEGQLLSLPRPTVSNFACLEASQMFSASNTEVRKVAATRDDPRSAVACSGAADDGLAAVRNTLRPTPAFKSEENLWTGYNASLNIHASESLSTSQIVSSTWSICNHLCNGHFKSNIKECKYETSVQTNKKSENLHGARIGIIAKPSAEFVAGLLST